MKPGSPTWGQDGVALNDPSRAVSGASVPEGRAGDAGRGLPGRSASSSHLDAPPRASAQSSSSPLLPAGPGFALSGVSLVPRSRVSLPVVFWQAASAPPAEMAPAAENNEAPPRDPVVVEGCAPDG